MGGKQSNEQKLEILNSTKVQTALSNVNENINKMTMNVVQESLSKTAAGAAVKQSIKIKGVKTEGDFTLSNIKQASNVTISVSSLTNSELQSQLVTDTMNDLQNKLQESMKMTQEQAQQKGEQMVAELGKALSGAMNSMTGTSVDNKSNTSIKNILDIQSDVELKNIVEQSISSDLINKTVTEIANNVVGDQTLEVEDVEAKGSVAITDIDQSFLSTQMLQAISSVGTGSEILSKIANVSKSDMTKSVEAGQKNSAQEQGTITAAGEAVSSVVTSWGDAVGNIFSSAAMGFILPIAGVALVLGVVYLMMNRGGKEQPPMMMPQQMQMMPEQVPEQMVQQVGGGLKKISSEFKKMYKKINKKINLKYVVITIIILAGLYYLFNRLRYVRFMEHFQDEVKLKKVVITNNSQNVRNEKLGSKKLCLNSGEGFVFNINIVDNKYMYFTTTIGKNDFNMRADDNELTIDKYDFIYDSEYKFKYTKVKDNVFTLSVKDKNVVVKDNCLTTSSEKPTEFIFVEKN